MIWRRAADLLPNNIQILENIQEVDVGGECCGWTHEETSIAAEWWT